MNIANKYTTQKLNSLYEIVSAYQDVINSLKKDGVASPEQTLKEYVKSVNESMEIVNESFDDVIDTSFANYFNYGTISGYRFEEIREAFDSNDESFLLENSFYSIVSNKVSAAKASGGKVHAVSVSSRNGVPYAEFTVTAKDGSKKRHILHNNQSTTQNLGKVSKNDPEERDEGV